MRPFTIYTAECTGNARNCQYPTEVIVQDIPTLQQAMGRDHVCAKYREDRRSAAGFQWSDCIPMDCDNDHSENPEEWKQPEDVISSSTVQEETTSKQCPPSQSMIPES